MDEIDLINKTIVDLQQEIRLLKEELNNMPYKVMENLPDDEKFEAAVYLYWSNKEIRVTDIAASIGLSHGQFRTQMKSKYAVLQTCRKCGNRFHTAVGSRSGNPDTVCNDCTEKERTISIRYLEETSRRNQELKTMPYREYLNTPEWQDRRKRHLKSVGYKCQVCNSGGIIDIHHRTYDRRGNEGYRDLIALCRDCHSLFHKEGKLSK